MAKAHETHSGKNATESAVRMMIWWPGIKHDVLRYVSKCKECQENMPSLGQTVSTWPEVEVWEKLRMDRGYVKDQSNILVIVDAGSGWIEAGSPNLIVSFGAFLQRVLMTYRNTSKTRG